MSIFSYGSYTEIRDPIYGFIKMPNQFLDIIDNRVFQRLRWIGQLPLQQLVYPSAQHSRLEHSLGVMHLSFKCVESLCTNDKHTMEDIFKDDKDLSKLPTIDQMRDTFTMAAGLVGLLHDIGHPPYSHTIEEALRYSSNEYKYDHEAVGIQIVKKTFAKKHIRQIYFQKAIAVLDKKIKEDKLSRAEKLLRSIIDGYFDVDKGDYLLRDSYHCGVTYGQYDHERLWSNVVVTPDNRIGIKEKAAIELWKMRFSRFSMFQNVYHHHTRNITDALLVEIILKIIDSNPEEIIPFRDSQKIKRKEIKKFITWTDTDIIRAIHNSGDRDIKKLANCFTDRRLYKRYDSISLTKKEAVGEIAGKELKSHLHEVFEKVKLDSNYNHLSYLLQKEPIAPVHEKGMAAFLIVKRKDKSYISLSEKFDLYTKPTPTKYTLYIFAKEPDKAKEANVTHHVTQAIKRGGSLFSIWN